MFINYYYYNITNLSDLIMNNFYAKKLMLFFAAILFASTVEASYLKNVPQKLVQPNGIVVNCYATGDEFYHWMHDEDGFTIVQNPETGYFCYAILSGDDLIASPYIVGEIAPTTVGLKPNINIPSQKMGQIREQFLGMEKAYRIKTSGRYVERKKVNTTGTINNVVVYIRFSDESEYSTNQTAYTEKFNSTTPGVLSQHNYFSEVSYGSLNLTSSFLPVNNGINIVSFQDSHPRAYYMSYNATSNPIGYTNKDDRTAREHTLLQAAVNSVSAQLDAGVNIDSDSDGNVDNVCFIVQGSSAGWSELLWPHKWSLYTKNAYIRGKKVDVYNFQLQNDLDVSVLCHEMFHTLGAPDLYHYTDGTPDPVGPWDLMNQNLPIPQHMTQYMKYRYGGWIMNIPEITTTGDYTLNPVFTKETSCYRVNSPYSLNEYFIIEYRKKEKADVGLPSEGLLVYRINTLADGEGNKNGPPDEVYVYRPGGSVESAGSLGKATFNATSGRVSFSDKTDPDPFLSDGSIGGLSISNISAAGATISFHVDIYTPFANDVAVTKVVTPVVGALLTSSEKIKVMVSGIGSNTITSGVKVNYRINGGPVVSQDFVGTLAKGTSVPFEFTVPIDLSSKGNYNLEVFTTLSEDLNTANDTVTVVLKNADELEYKAALARTLVETYTELTSGSIIAVDQAKDGLSSPVTFPDGFEFKYCGQTFTKFILSSNGFIKLGDQNPTRSLYFYEPQSAEGGLFNSSSVIDNNIIAPFNHDLVAGSGGAEYRMDISGTAPNRVVTIQFKNVSDNSALAATQYSSMNFQIKLYETTRVIDFVFGNWTSSANASAYKTSLSGLRGLGNLPSQLLAINKGSGVEWGDVTFANGNYSTTATLNFGNTVGGTRPAPVSGQVIRLTPQQENDVAVLDVYTMAQLPLNFGAPHMIQAVVCNYGKTVKTGVNVTLSVSGANSFAPAAVVIPTLNPGDTVIVSFDNFTPTALGENSVTVSLADDDYSANNTKSVNQTVNSGTYSFAATGATAESAFKGSFIAVCKYHVTGSAKVTSVDAMILNNSALSAQTTKAYVFNKSGVVVGQSNSFTTSANSLGKWVSFAILTPPTVIDADYYVGLDCSNSYFAAYQTEQPMRAGAFYQIPVGGGTPVEVDKDLRFMFRANVSTVTGVDSEVATDVRIYSDTKVLFVEIPTLNAAAQLIVYNILGNQVYRTNDLSQGLTRIENNFNPGIYIVRLSNGDKVYTQRVVMQ
jgi:M6 family metalloprotease-like protein